MTCPGGCIGGGGQPKDKSFKGDELRKKRIQGLYSRDKQLENRVSNENEEIKRLYEEFYGKPLSDLAEQMLHTTYKDRSYQLGSKISSENKNDNEVKTSKYRCTVCNYVHEGELSPEECPISHVPKDKFVKL